MTRCSTGSQRTFSRNRREGIEQKIKKERPLRVSVAGSRKCGEHGNKGGTRWTWSWGNGLKLGRTRGQEDELGKSWAQVGLFLSPPIFLPSADEN